MKACKNQVQWTSNYERSRFSDTLNTMKLEHIFKSNTIKDVTDTIKEMLESFTVTEKVISNKLQIQEKQLKVEISKNSNNKLELKNTL